MSQVLRVPKAVLLQIDKLLPNLFKTLISKKLQKTKQGVGVILFTDPHSGMIHPATVYVKPFSKSGWEDAVRCDQFENGMVEIVFNYKHRIWKELHSDKKLKIQIRNSLIHEMNHALDPRPTHLQSSSHAQRYVSQKRHWLDYYTDQGEFDAFCNEIIDWAVNDVQQNGTNLTKARWEHLLKCEINPLGEIFSNTVRGAIHQEVILAWICSDNERKTDCMKRFKIRLYNALHENLNTGRQPRTSESVPTQPVREPCSCN